MQLTNSYGLKKPDGTDLVNIEDLNYNADILDKAMKSAETASSAAQAAATAAQTASTEAKTTAESANTTAMGASKVAADAKTAADTATSTATLAKTTADTAKTTADTAMSTATTAKTTADQATKTAAEAKTTALDAQAAAANAIKTESVTLSHSGWNRSAKTLTASVTGVTADNSLIIGLAGNATDDQAKAATSAGVRGISQASNSITFKCVAVPTVDIPLSILIIG